MVTETMTFRANAVLVAILILPAYSQVAPDFRAATWGMSRDQVSAVEGERPSEVRDSNGETLVEYAGLKLGALDATAVYIFSGNRLVRAKYLIEAGHPDDLNLFIADYHAVESELRGSLGQPADQKALWIDDSLQEERKSYLDQDRATPEDILPSDRNVGLAVSVGFLKLYTEWSTPRTRILHTLTGMDGEIVHQIEYASKQLNPAAANSAFPDGLPATGKP